ncbi:ROK family protein, partial [Streptomyces sp. NPDC051771]|uniref:ROK family protein n=1 Tax=Streptomyces sp. NPDC051771 TaxID=3154847 RepID=UPI0034458968
VRGRRCRCGAQGCLEAYAGAEALLERWREAGGRPPAGADEETALTAMLAAAYPAPPGPHRAAGGPEPAGTGAAGGGAETAGVGAGAAGVGTGAVGAGPDAAAVLVLDETAEYLGAGLADLINLFQPERILVGGWAGLQLGSRFLAAVSSYARAYALRHPGGRTEIALGTLGPEAVTVGAGLLPLVDFFAQGGRRPERAPSIPAPAWQTALRDRVST